MYILIYIYIYVYVCMHACMHACMYVCMYVYIHIITQTYVVPNSLAVRFRHHPTAAWKETVPLRAEASLSAAALREGSFKYSLPSPLGSRAWGSGWPGVAMLLFREMECEGGGS